MASKRKQDNTPAGRLMRQATAYARLAAKAHRSGNHTAYARYQAQYLRLRDQANRARERKADQ